MRFSQRIGKSPIEKNIQIDSIDEELKNGLWNLITIHIFDIIPRLNARFSFRDFAKIVWHQHYKLPIDKIDSNNHFILSFMRSRFYSDEWFNVYDFVEYLTTLNIENVNTFNFVNAVNKLLEKEFSGYRFIDYKLCPITNEQEIKEISDSIS